MSIMRHRHRSGFYPLAKPSLFRSISIKMAVSSAVGLLFFYAAARIFSFFEVGNEVRQNPAMLLIDSGGTVSVSIEEGEMKMAENNIKIYPNDRVQTGARSNASIVLFDDSVLRLDEQSELSLVKSSLGNKKSEWKVVLNKGSIWLAAPADYAFTGSIVRSVGTGYFSLEVPSAAESIISQDSFAVFSADDLGIKVSLAGHEKPIFIGEGQSFSITRQQAITDDPYDYRSVLDPRAVTLPFLEQSRNAFSLLRSQSEISTSKTSNERIPAETLMVAEPEDGVTVRTSTVVVKGSVGADVSGIRINGRSIAIDNSRAFMQDIALPDEDQTNILIEAIGEDGQILEETRRNVKRDRKPPDTPVIDYPAFGGETFLTSQEDIEISGKVSADAVGIEVNDYRLQLFEPGDETWAYLASTKLGNFSRGENVFIVTAINKGGYKSEPAVIKIILGEGEEGVIKTEEGMGEDAADSDEGDERTISNASGEGDSTKPDNLPLFPGSLKVIGPTPGAFHSATGGSFLLEGTTLEQTHSIWVNHYRLRLYEPGKTFWNYIADTKLGTLHRGTNIFRIVSRDKENKILDEVNYTVKFNPRGR